MSWIFVEDPRQSPADFFAPKPAPGVRPLLLQRTCQTLIEGALLQERGTGAFFGDIGKSMHMIGTKNLLDFSETAFDRQFAMAKCSLHHHFGWPIIRCYVSGREANQTTLLKSPNREEATTFTGAFCGRFFWPELMARFGRSNQKTPPKKFGNWIFSVPKLQLDSYLWGVMC